MDVLRTACDLAADRKSVTVLELTVGDGDVLARVVGTRRVDHAALDGDVVVSNISVDMVDDDVAGAEGINRVRIRRVNVGDNPDVVDLDVIRVVRNKLPVRRVLDGNAFDKNVLAVIEDDEARPRVLAAEHTGVLRAPSDLPPALSRSVDDAPCR